MWAGPAGAGANAPQCTLARDIKPSSSFSALMEGNKNTTFYYTLVVREAIHGSLRQFSLITKSNSDEEYHSVPIQLI